MGLYDDTRSAWKAVKPTSTKAVPITARTEFFVHWNGGPLGLFGKPHAECLRAVKAIQAEHMHDDPDHGWSDIGYNALVCPHARLIEGRGRDYAGAHCPGHNTSGIAVQFMLGEGEHPTEAMKARVRRFYDNCCQAAGRALTRKGHRDDFATACPGAELYTWVRNGLPANTKEEPVTPADVKAIVNGLLNADVIPAPNPTKTNPTFTVKSAIEWCLRRSSQSYSETLRLGKALEALAETLPAESAKALLDALSQDYDADVVLTPKEGS